MASDALQRLEGLHTVDSAASALGLARQSTLNTLCKLKKEGHVTVQGGGKQPRLYKVTLTKQLPRREGMFDVLNKHNPHFKLNEWYDHQVHGTYTEEDAILDAIETRSFRAILATLRLFNHVHDWPKLYREAKRRGIWNEVGALYDAARVHLRVRRMPKRYAPEPRKKLSIMTRFGKERNNYPRVEAKWRVVIPFNAYDVRDVAP